MTGQPDEHIFKFLQAKFGIAETDDFDAKLYLCNGAFQFLPFDTFGRLLGEQNDFSKIKKILKHFRLRTFTALDSSARWRTDCYLCQLLSSLVCRC